MPDDTFPPSFSDCVVKEEYREEIEAIAECYYYGVKDRLEASGVSDKDELRDVDKREEPCVEMAEDLGMELLSSGVARSAFSVVPDPEPSEPTPDGPTHYEQCVFKFARYGNYPKVNGKHQTKQEIDNYESFPDKMVEPQGDKPPIFNPLKDYDDADNLWLTQPYCPPPGSKRNVVQRLHSKGYQSNDLHADNIGTYPTLNETAIIDYGLGIQKRGTDITSMMDDLEDGLSMLGAYDIEREAFANDGGEVQFYPSKDTPGQEPPTTKSHIKLDRDGKVQGMDIFFFGFPSDVFTRTQMVNEMDGMFYEPSLRIIEVNSYVDIGRDSIGANFTLNVPRGAVLSPEEAIAEFEKLQTSYDGHFAEFVTTGQGSRDSGTISGGVSGVSVAQGFVAPDVQWRNSLEGIGMRKVQPDTAPPVGFGADITFLPPEDNSPHPTKQTSAIYYESPATVEKVMYKAAEVSVGINTRADVRSTAFDVGGQMNKRFSFASFSGSIRYYESDPVGSGDIFTIEYKVTPTKGYMSPQQVIDALDALTNAHNARFDNPGA